MATDVELEDQWFVAACYFVAEIEGQVPSDPVFEETFFLINAKSEYIAQQYAHQFVSDEQVSYKNAEGQDVFWHFTGKMCIQRLEQKLAHGSEVFSRFIDTHAYSSLTTELPDAYQGGGPR